MFSERLPLVDGLTSVRVQAAVAEYGSVRAVMLALLALAAVALVADYAHMLYMRSQMPPGPFPWPIVGNTFSLPERKPWIYFEELSNRYNTPLITFWIGRYVLFCLLLGGSGSATHESERR